MTKKITVLGPDGTTAMFKIKEVPSMSTWTLARKGGGGGGVSVLASGQILRLGGGGRRRRRRGGIDDSITTVCRSASPPSAVSSGGTSGRGRAAPRQPRAFQKSRKQVITTNNIESKKVKRCIKKMINK